MDVQTVCFQIFSLTIWSLVYLTTVRARTCSRTIIRICRSSLDILSTPGVKIEPYKKSHVELALDASNTSNGSEFRLNFDFRTRFPDGILFYSRSADPQELIAMVLSEGDIIYKTRSPHLHADVRLTARNNSMLNDGRWHTIDYRIRYGELTARGHLEIDGFTSNIPRQYTVGIRPLKTLIIGGLSQSLNGRTAQLQNGLRHFRGCIRNVSVPVTLSRLPKYYAVSVCD